MKINNKKNNLPDWWPVRRRTGFQFSIFCSPLPKMLWPAQASVDLINTIYDTIKKLIIINTK
jgi:hypothetical protein